MMFRRRVSKWQGYNVKLMAPYLVAVLAVGIVGLQVTSNLGAEPETAGMVELTTDKPVYRLGETVRFTVLNKTAGVVTVNNDCPGEPLEVYYQDAGQWRQRQATAAYDAKCQDEPRQYPVAAGKSVSATYRYWDGLFDKPGRYRLVAPLQGTAERPAVEFNVVGSQ